MRASQRTKKQWMSAIATRRTSATKLRRASRSRTGSTRRRGVHPRRAYRRAGGMKRSRAGRLSSRPKLRIRGARRLGNARRRGSRRQKSVLRRFDRRACRSKSRTGWLSDKRKIGGRFRHRLAAVVTCRDEERTLPTVLRQLERLPMHEIIVVINGSTDRSLELASRFRNVTIVWLHEPLGHDVGRAVGARVATADVILFMDGDLPIRAERLVPFLRAVDRGADLALNDLTPFIGMFAEQDDVTRIKMFLNRVLGRPDLGMNSMTAVPHAVSKRLIDTVGIEWLAVPPKAHAIAVMNGLTITSPASVDVIRRNRIRPHNIGLGNPVADLIIGDHLEALSLIIQQRGSRGAYPDMTRRREIARGADDADEHHYTVI